MLKRHVYSKPEGLFDFIAGELERYSAMPQAQHICLCGGTTPKALFNYISSSDYRTRIHWGNLHFWWGDERCVPTDSTESNYGEAKRLLFDHIDLPDSHLHPIISPDLKATQGGLSEKNCQLALDTFIENLTQLLESHAPIHDALAPPKFDWVLLGIGEDGHTASLFPENFDPGTDANALLVIKPGTKDYRISLSARCIAAARRVSYLVTGKNKAKVLADIFEHAECAKRYPAAQIRSLTGETDYYLDQDAASILINCQA